jgi:hypothetical protein
MLSWDGTRTRALATGVNFSTIDHHVALRLKSPNTRLEIGPSFGRLAR